MISEAGKIKKHMKIVAGLGSADDYERLIRAGADECFCGYVPFDWSRRYGTVMPLNRREVLCCQVQIGAFSEMQILAKMIKKYKKPVHLTFNALYYLPEQYPKIANIIESCMEIGFQSYIIADPALILHLREHHLDCEIHLSGECSEVNRAMVEQFQKFDLKRVIFHRKNTFADMASVISQEKAAGGKRGQTEFEAFVLNEMCQFTGAFCNSLHCDELGYLCHVPYQMDSSVKTPQKENSEGELEDCKSILYDESGYLCGASGCGLCALYRLQKAGITHLKLVGRGNFADFMEKDIRNLCMARNVLESSCSEKDFCEKMKQSIFPKGCSKKCYYPGRFFNQIKEVPCFNCKQEN